MNLHRLDLVSLSLFSLVARTSSISKGAELAHLAVGAASKRISDLEDSVGASLLERHSRGVTLKVLGVVNEKRVSALPDVPTIGETLKGFGSTPWYDLFAPAGTPKPLIAQLQAEVAKVLDAPDTKEKLATVGCEPAKSTPEQLAALVKDDLPKWAKIVKDSGATVD